VRGGASRDLAVFVCLFGEETCQVGYGEL